MGLFSPLRTIPANAVTPADNIARAILAPALLVAAPDGVMDNTDQTNLIKACLFSPIFDAMGAERTSQLVAAGIDDLKSRGQEAVIRDAIDTLSPKLRETAMCFSIRVALVDGLIESTEFDVLSQIAEQMGLEVELFDRMFTILSMLQRDDLLT